MDGWHPRKHIRYYGGDEVYAVGQAGDADGEGVRQQQQQREDGDVPAGALPNPAEAWAHAADWGFDDPEGDGQSEGSWAGDPEDCRDATPPPAVRRGRMSKFAIAWQDEPGQQHQQPPLTDEPEQQQRQQQQQQSEWWEDVWGMEGVG